VKEWKGNYQFKMLFNYQVIIGIISNIPVATISFIYDDLVLATICVVLLIVTILSYLISRYYNFLIGVHLMLLSYFICFFYASFTHLVSYPLILVYPIILALSVLYSRSNFVRLSYAVLCICACTYNVYLQHIYFGSNLFASEILPSILITIGLMVAFPVIIITNSDMLYLYQEQLEKQRLTLKHNNEELNSYISSNLQLENFAHLASHELRTPLNNVINFTSLLKKKASHKLEDQELEIMEVVTSEVGRMNTLIEDLLQLSMVENAEVSFSKIDINNFLNHLIEKYFSESKSILITDLDLKNIVGHKDLLAQLFINLIENAIKFSKNSTNQKIEIKGREQSDFYHFSIIDNGIGIDEEFKERVFLIFKKLHNNAEYEGTGIGLSICKRIVERHKGSIGVKDNPAGGTIFEFSLSKHLNLL